MSALVAPTILLEDATARVPLSATRPDAGGERIYLSRVLLTNQETLVQQWYGDHAVQLQTLDLSCGDHPRDQKTHDHGGNQIDEHRESESDHHHDEVFALDTVERLEETPIDDVPTDSHQDTGQDRVGTRLDVLPEAQNERKQDRRAQSSGDSCPSTGPQVYHRAYGGPGTG